VIIIKNKIIFPILVIFALLGAAVVGITSVKAQEVGSQSTTIVQLIANKFSLNQADVQAVFDQHRSDQRAQNLVRYTQMLDQAVTDGKLTTAQKQLILTKHQELQTNRQTERTALETWAKANNIDPKYLFGGFGQGRGGMMKNRIMDK
jgi:hypothetical protein